MIQLKRFITTYPYFCKRIKIDYDKYKNIKYTNNSNNKICATKIFNYMNDNPIIDWLNLYYDQSSKKIDEFSEFLKEQGNIFEKNIIKTIQDNGHNVVKVSDKYSDESVQTTIKYMKQGIPIIHSAPVFNAENNTYGIIDLLIRSDYINKLFQEKIIELENIKAPNLSGNYHYLVVDIKYKTIDLRNNGLHISNSKNIQSYKGQIFIYNQAISKIQGYNPNIGFILGRKYIYKKDGIKYTINNPFGKLGIIDYEGIDKFIPEKIDKAIQWINDVREYGKDWNIEQPDREELYPNLKKDNGEWIDVITKLANKNNDITMLWNCGKRKRDYAFSKNIKTWTDQKCTSKVLGFENLGENIISKMLEINKGGEDIILPVKLSDHSIELIKNNNNNEIFLDFETFQDFDDNNIPIIFLIGIYYYNNIDKKYDYKKFLINEKNQEKQNIQDFLDFYKSLENPKIYYWYAEKSLWINNILKKYPEFETILSTLDSTFIDLYKIFKNEPIVIKGCFNYGLKSITQKMYDHNMINIILDTSCKNGKDAILNAYKIYSNKIMDESLKNKMLDDITMYNKFDVESLYEILNFLRKKYL